MENNQPMNTAPAMGEKKASHWMHFHCCIGPLLKTIFWVGGVVAFILAWVAGDATAWGYPATFWFVNALTLGVLAAGSGKRSGMCRMGGCCGKGACAGGMCSSACGNCK